MVVCALISCGHGTPLNDGTTVSVSAGAFTMGSTPVQRANATELSVRAGTYGRDTARALEDELDVRQVNVPAFAIMKRPVTHADYYAFVVETGASEPYVHPARWSGMNTGYAYAFAERSMWPLGIPPTGRADHPVVLVSRDDAQAYCDWWGHTRNGYGALPTEQQWEKAARGRDGRSFPWGEHFDPGLVNSAEGQRNGTVAVGAHSATASPYGALDMAGNVFEWTATRHESAGWVVKGGAFSADASSARAAARHGRLASARHPAIGFRCVLTAYP